MYSSNETVLDRDFEMRLLKKSYSDIWCTKNSDYASEIRAKLNYIAEVWRSSVPLQEYRFSIIEERGNSVRLKFDDGGDIIVPAKV